MLGRRGSHHSVLQRKFPSSNPGLLPHPISHSPTPPPVTFHQTAREPLQTVPRKAEQIASHLENLPGFQIAYKGLTFQDVLVGGVVVNCNDQSTPRTCGQTLFWVCL